MKYQTNDYSYLVNIGEISNEAMQMHFKLYEGYVNNVNIILEKLNTLEKNSPEYNELRRRFGWEWNGMRLHELFFDSLVGEGGGVAAAPNAFIQKISTDFGSFENWKVDFIAMCKIRGMGWAMLVQDKKTGRFLNTWVNEHEQGMMADVNIILNVDMFEHAYIKDFGTDRQKYIDSIFAHLDFDKILGRI